MASLLADRVYDQLLSQIIERKYKPGDRLPSEAALCEELQVSRNTLRAAINKLCILGFTETRRGGGTYVKTVGSDVYLNFFVPALLTSQYDLLQIMQLRRGVEVESARAAAMNATEEDIEELTLQYQRCCEDISRMSEFADNNISFHTVVAKASHNILLEKMMDIIRMMTLQELQGFQVAQGTDIDSTFFHRMVLECIKNRKPDEAAYFMSRHLDLVIDRVSQYVHENQTESEKAEKTEEKEY